MGSPNISDLNTPSVSEQLYGTVPGSEQDTTGVVKTETSMLPSHLSEARSSHITPLDPNTGPHSYDGGKARQFDLGVLVEASALSLFLDPR